jgi:hypothetical protein
LLSLSAQAAAPNLLLTWPDASGAYMLQQSASLASPNWTAVPAAVVLVNGANQVTVPLSGATSFYRLIMTNAPSF